MLRQITEALSIVAAYGYSFLVKLCIALHLRLKNTDSRATCNFSERPSETQVNEAGASRARYQDCRK